MINTITQAFDAYLYTIGSMMENVTPEGGVIMALFVSSVVLGSARIAAKEG